MGAFTAGQVVLLPFPFPDLTPSKLRPALILADAGRAGKLLTANSPLFAAAAGTVAQVRLDEVRNALVAIIKEGAGEP